MPGGATAAQETLTAELRPIEGISPPSASARAVFQIDEAGERIEFELFVHNVEGMSGAHLHMWPSYVTSQGVFYDIGALDREGPIVAFLLPFSSKGMTGDGLVASGTITQDKLIGEHRKLPFSSLIRHVREGHTYVSIHVREVFQTGDVFCCPNGLRGQLGPPPSE